MPVSLPSCGLWHRHLQIQWGVAERLNLACATGTFCSRFREELRAANSGCDACSEVKRGTREMILEGNDSATMRPIRKARLASCGTLHDAQHPWLRGSKREMHNVEYVEVDVGGTTKVR